MYRTTKSLRCHERVRPSVDCDIFPQNALVQLTLVSPFMLLPFCGNSHRSNVCAQTKLCRRARTCIHEGDDHRTPAVLSNNWMLDFSQVSSSAFARIRPHGGARNGTHCCRSFAAAAVVASGRPPTAGRRPIDAAVPHALRRCC